MCFEILFKHIGQNNNTTLVEREIRNSKKYVFLLVRKMKLLIY